MVNKNIFSSVRNLGPIPDTFNEAGGRAYSLSNENALAQYAVTGCLNGTYYAGGEEHLATTLELAQGCSSEFVAQVAAYAHRVARMKDMPALLLGVLANRGAEGIRWLAEAFPHVVSGTKMLRNFVQIVRSGQTGRKSFGTALKRLIQNWLQTQSADALFRGSVGQTPSLADVVKMVHPKPESVDKDAFYAWLLGKKLSDSKKEELPLLLTAFERFKTGASEEVPAVDFRMLTALPLSVAQWRAIARSASWNTLRMNLNTFARHKCFEDKQGSILADELANKLRNPDEVRRANAFPYQLLTTYQNIGNDIPMVLRLALQDAMEIATENVPALQGNTAVLVDVSSSMTSPVTGFRQGSTTKTECVHVAGLIACSLLRSNPSTTNIVAFNTSAQDVVLNPRDSVMTNASYFRGNGGTDCSASLRLLNANDWRGKNVVMVSDNMSWYNDGGYGSTGVVSEWRTLKKRNPQAKLVCINLQPYGTVQVPNASEVLNVGGFTDSVFTIVKNFVDGSSDDFAKRIREFSLDFGAKRGKISEDESDD